MCVYIASDQSCHLWNAATEGNLAAVRHLLRTPHIDVNFIGTERMDTPLHRACRFGMIEVLRELLARQDVNVNKGNAGEATPFCIACQEGHRDVVIILLSDARVDVNAPTANGTTPFFKACYEGHDDIVEVLLNDPRVDVNQPKHSEATPFFMACQEGHDRVVKLLVDDPRVDVNTPYNSNTTPLWIAAQLGRLLSVQILLASDRQVETATKSMTGPARWHNKTAAEIGLFQTTRRKDPNELAPEYERRKLNGRLISNLIGDYERDPLETKLAMQQLPGIREYFIGELFGVVIFHGDGFLQFRESRADTDVKRFFALARALPLDLQMVLCNRAYHSPLNLVLTKYSEPAFRRLSKPSSY